MDAEYFKHLDRIKAAAAERRLDLVPAMFQIGHSENLLAQDPNLAEGLPVRDQLFVVRGGVARVEADPPVAFRPTWDHRDESMSTDWIVKNPAGKLARGLAEGPRRPLPPVPRLGFASGPGISRARRASSSSEAARMLNFNCRA